MPELKTQKKPEKQKKEKWVRPSEIIYHKLAVNGIEIPEDKLKIRASEMATVLGWHPVGEEDRPGMPAPTLNDLDGNEIRLLNNTSNRPFDLGLAKTWMSELLKGHWQVNGETMIVGKTGLNIAVQHRGVGLMLAVQEWKKRPEKYPFWKEEPYILGLLVTGIEETDSVINTVDTGKPRSTADAIYRSEIFAKDKPADRKVLARMLEYAVRFVWDRTGAKKDAYAPKRTHTDTFDYLELHGRLVKCVHHIFGEDQGGKDKEGNEIKPRISQYVSPGTAAGMMYLMGSSASDVARYREGDPPSERRLDWSNWDKAEKFWAEFNKAPKLEVFAQVYKSLIDKETGKMPSSAEVKALTAKLWTAYLSGAKEILPKDVKPKYAKDEDGIYHLAECPLFGGIDLGNPKDDDQAETPSEPDEETKEEQEERKREVRQQKESKNGKPAQKTREEVLDDLKREHKNEILLFKDKKGGGYVAWREDAVLVSQLTKLPMKKEEDMQKVPIHNNKYEECLKKLLDSGSRVSIVEQVPSGGMQVEEAKVK